ncbi:MAG: hypothetical protein ACOX2A_09525 [Tepidanaerobacteraceae bacterium]|nr:hypothetical protein [Thermoanaerobacterales bacterium]
MLNAGLLVAILALSIYLIGYTMGRRIGKKEGIFEGKAIIPIELKKQMLDTMICPLCKQKLNFYTNCDSIHNRK